MPKAGQTAYWICAEVLLFIGAAAGFYSVVHRSAHSREQETLLQQEDGETDDAKLVSVVKSITAAAKESRVFGIVALVCTCLSFFMATVLARILRIVPR